MKKILILHTGGTIAMHRDVQTGAITPESANPLLQFHFPIEQDIQFESEEIFNLPSPHITPNHMLVLKERIQAGIKAGVSGVVITHGTDTLEETAYFLDLTLPKKVPIVITGAMRSSNEIGSDGLYNFQTAIRVACTEEAKDKGVLVVMNDEIHAARYVTKTHTTNVATFRTPTFGPIGLVTKDQILFFQKLIHQTALDIQNVEGRIPIIKAYAGMDDELLGILTASAIDGLVIEALGAGNLPPQTLSALETLLNKEIPVLLVSRCFNGIAEGVYGYEGGGQQLIQKGILFCPALNGPKARLKLLVALNANLSKQELKNFILSEC